MLHVGAYMLRSLLERDSFWVSSNFIKPVLRHKIDSFIHTTDFLNGLFGARHCVRH